MKQQMTSEEYIEHYGVKGMKWGVRKPRNEKERKKTFGKEKSEDRARADEIRKKPIKTLSNKELADFNQRMNLEMQFSRVNPGRVKRGEAKAKTIIGLVGTAGTLYALRNDPVVKVAVNHGRKALGLPPLPDKKDSNSK